MDKNFYKDLWLVSVSDLSVQNIGQAIIQTSGAPIIKISPAQWWLIGGEPDALKSRTTIITAITLK